MKKATAFILLGVFSLIIASILLSGCNTYQKQLNKFQGFAIQHPGELAKMCQQYYPAKDSVGKTVTDSTHKADNKNYQTKIDSLKDLADMLKQQFLKDTSSSNPCASVAKKYQSQVLALNNKIQDLKNTYKPCKPDTVYKTQTIYRVDQAAIKVLQDKLTIQRDSTNELSTELKIEKETSSSRLRWVFILGGILLASIAITVLKFIGKL